MRKRSNSNSTPITRAKKSKIKNGYEEIKSYVSRMPKFSTTNHITEFVLHNASQSPDESLLQIFDDLIDQAFANVKNTSGREVQLFSILIFGEGLHSPIVIPARRRDQNSANVILNEIDILDQSDKKINFLNNPIKFIISCVSPPQGTGKLNPIIHLGVNDKARIFINNKDQYCLFYALEVGRVMHDQSEINELKKFNCEIPSELITKQLLSKLKNDLIKQRTMAEKLMEESSISRNESAYGISHIKKVQDFYNQKYGFGKYRIILFDSGPVLKPLWKSPNFGKFQIILFLENGHYDLLTRINSYFKLGKRQYCIDCETTYTHSNKHRKDCASRCYYCSKMGSGICQAERNVEIICDDCNRIFYSKKCYDIHITRMCKLYKKCIDCKRVYQVGKKAHICDDIYCRKCHVHHPKDRGCTIQPIEKTENEPVKRILTYDFEATQDLEIYAGINEHRINYCNARWCCTNCADLGEEDDCTFCRPNYLAKEDVLERNKSWNGPKTLDEFVDWVLTSWDSSCNTFIFAHYGGKYDHHFIMQRLYAKRMRPEVIMSGCKIYQMTVRLPKMSKLFFRDSYLLMSVPLADLKKTFSLECDNKLYFPHLWNKESNYNVKLPCLPDIKYYCPGGMKENKRKEFEIWYNEHKNESFLLSEKLAEYCQNDTEILMCAVLKMRNILLEITDGFDVFLKSATIAGVCMTIFRSMFMKKDCIGIVPEKGYEKCDRASPKAIRYMEWREYKDGVKIRHAGNGREARIGKYKLDGYIKIEKKAIEFNGCIYHGHIAHLRPNDMGPNGKTTMENYESTMKRIKILRERVDVEVVWECEVDAQIKNDPEMKEFFMDCHTKGRIEPREGYFGGRTGPLSLYAKTDENHTISVFDIISLYPSVNFYESYPVGVPEIIYPRERVVNWKKSTDILYNGLLKVHVIPPKNLLHPVIPIRLPGDDRLLFTNCATCAKIFKKKCTKINWKCKHSDEERSFTSTVTSIELKEALNNNYRVDRFYRAWHYTEWEDNLFKDYVRMFLKLKLESSGFPEGIKTNKQKKFWSEKYVKQFGIKIEMDKVEYNAGLRHIAKLALNSLWGKFSQRNSLRKNIVITNPSEYYEYIFNPKLEISMILPVSDETIRLVYKEKEEFIEENSVSNIILSLWTTSAARLALYKYMRIISDTPGCTVLYTDTDSVIFKHPINVSPIPEGEFLGQMSREYAEFQIVEFLSGGAKQYALKMLPKNINEKDANESDYVYVVKLRGITLDAENSNVLQFEKFKAMVMNYGSDDFVKFNYTRIQPRQDSVVISRRQIKKYMPIMQKGIINPKNLHVYPFGFEK